LPNLRLSLRRQSLLAALIALPLGCYCRLAFLLGTEYAPDYDEAKFMAIYVGYDRKRVESMIGKPFKITNGASVVDYGGRVYTNVTRYEYSRSPIDHDYEVRDVWFDSFGRVVVRWFHHWCD